MKTLSCDRVRKTFDGVRALDDLTLQFPARGIVGIVGPNGAGKTTLLNILSGFLRPDAGRCFLGGREISQLSPDRIVQLGVSRTFQDLRLVKQVPALENVMLAMPGQRGEKLFYALSRFGTTAEESRNREEALRLLRFVGLGTAASTLSGKLSYGQQKLLTIACCVATGAEILLLDEPFAGVDPQMIDHLIILLKRLSDEQRLIIFIEHNLLAVRRVAEHLIVLDEGKVIGQGPPGEVLEKQEVMEAYIA